MAKDAGPAWTSVWGVAGVPFTSADQSGGVAAITDTPSGSQRIVLDDLEISCAAAMSVTIKEETSGTVIRGPYYMPANGTIQLTFRGKKKNATAGKRLMVITGAAGAIMVNPGYHYEG